MDPLTIGIIGMIVLGGLIALGVRVVFATALVGFVGLIAIFYIKPNFDLWRAFSVAGGIAGQTPHSKAVAYPLSVLPMFILIGFLAFYAGITKAVFEAARRWIGWVPGGLAVASVFATAGFAAVSGASTSTAAVFARIAIPEMLKNGYDRKLAAGVVAAGWYAGVPHPAQRDPCALRDHRRGIGWRAVARRFPARPLLGSDIRLADYLPCCPQPGPWPTDHRLYLG